MKRNYEDDCPICKMYREMKSVATLKADEESHTAGCRRRESHRAGG